MVFITLFLFSAACALAEATPDSSALNRQFQAAISCYQNRQYDKAQQLLDGLLKQVPNSFQLNELMGMVYAAERLPANASPYFAKAVQIKPGSAEARMHWAASLSALHQNSQAEREFKSAVRLRPDAYDTNHNLGEFYIAAGKLPLAVPYLVRAQQANPSSYNNGYDLVLAEIKTHQYADAKTNLTRLLHTHNAADLHSLLAAADEQTGQYVQAAREYQLAARMSPTEDNIFAWGSELLLHHTLEPAITVFQRGVQLYPRSARMQIGYGIALYSRADYEDAINAFCHAVDLNPDDRRPYMFLGKIYDVSPLQAQTVTKRFARYARLQPNNPQALYYYGLSLWKAFRTQATPVDFYKVEGLLEKAVNLDPSFAEAHLELGIFYFQQHRVADAIAQYRQAIKAQPDLADAHYRLGEALVRSGQRAAAQQQFQIFSRLHAQQVKERENQRSEIMQFVYTAVPPADKPR